MLNNIHKFWGKYLRLLFDSTELSYYLEKSGHRAGVFTVALNIFRELKKRNDVELAFVCNFKRYYFMKEVMEQVDEFSGIKLLNENSIVNRLLGYLNYAVRNLNKKFVYGILILSRFYENIFYVTNKMNKEQFEKFNFYFSPFSPPCKEISESKVIKRYRILHDTIPIMENNNQIPKSAGLWCYGLYNSINNEDFYFTNSENTKNDFVKYYSFLNPNRIKTVYLGVNENFEEKIDKNASEKYIFSLCTLGKRKNLIFAIKNFFKFIEKNKIEDLKMVLGGAIWTKFENELRSQIKNFDKSKLIFTGYLTEYELPEYYSNALMFVFPSLYEGFGLPVLEAMKCGCPVITSNISSLPEVIGDCGIKINPKSDDEMVDAYEKLYYDDSFRESCKLKGLKRAEQFNWKNCTDAILNEMECLNEGDITDC